MKRSFLDVPTRELLIEDLTFRSSLERDSKDLAESMGKVGPLVPLRVQTSPDGLRIVSGFLRAEAALGLGLESLPAELLEKKEPFSILLACLHENNLTRGFTWAERAWVLERLLYQWEVSRNWILTEVLPAMGLPSSPKSLEEHLRAASIRDDLRRALLRHGCSLANALRFSRLEPCDQQALVELLPSLHLGENLLREVLELLWEIQLRDGLRPSQILSDPKLLQAMDERGQDRPQRTSVLRQHLRKIRMPYLSSMVEAFDQARKALGLPPQVSIQHSEFFESMGVTVRFTAKIPGDFVQIAARLWEASQKEAAMRDLFEATDFTSHLSGENT